MDASRFAKDFLWGVSTSCYQIEGAAAEDGRSPSIWDRFARTPGKVVNGETGDIACDHYHRYPEDVALMAELGVDAYRFSTAWPRILPEGTGAVNEAGLAFYDRLVDSLLERSIEPWICLHHWDLPAVLEDRGGWRNRDVAGWFADYTHAVASRLGDRVKHFFPFNEPNVLMWLGHATGEHAPGHADREAALAALHHINLAFGRSAQAIRAAAPDARTGQIISLQPCEPGRDDPAHRQAAETIDLFWNLAMVDPILLGRYPEPLADMLAPWVKPGDLETIAQPINLFGLNHYCRMFCYPDPESPFGARIGETPSGPTTDMGWLIDGTGLRDQLLRLVERYGKQVFYVTENGGAFPDGAGADGRVDDRDRIAYFEDYLSNLLEARDRGVDIRGYFVWSFMDNYEWSLGYAKRFGIVHVDYATQKRTPKASFDWLQDLIARSRAA
ncbi:MAG: GH1 family beta-glucosidase [Azospirillaceae bacterium]